MFNNGFPLLEIETVSKAISILPLQTYGSIGTRETVDQLEFFQNGKVIKFPYRIYYVETQDAILNTLPEKEKAVIHCIYTRSCDGFVRDKNIKALLSTDYPDWAIPYIVKVCDEYVVEILETVYDFLHDQNNKRIKQFCIENKQTFCLSYNRMISYWNEFYRRDCYHFEDYIGRKLFTNCFGYTRSMERRL